MSRKNSRVSREHTLALFYIQITGGLRPLDQDLDHFKFIAGFVSTLHIHISTPRYPALKLTRAFNWPSIMSIVYNSIMTPMRQNMIFGDKKKYTAQTSTRWTHARPAPGTGRRSLRGPRSGKATTRFSTVTGIDSKFSDLRRSWIDELARATPQMVYET